MAKYKCLVCDNICESDTAPETCVLCNAPSSKIVEYEKYQAEQLLSKQQLKQKIAKNKANNTPCCPKCGSKAIEAVNREYSIIWGFFGSGKTMNYCKNCGHKWEPGKK